MAFKVGRRGLEVILSLKYLENGWGLNAEKWFWDRVWVNPGSRRRDRREPFGRDRGSSGSGVEHWSRTASGTQMGLNRSLQQGKCGVI